MGRLRLAHLRGSRCCCVRDRDALVSEYAEEAPSSASSSSALPKTIAVIGVRKQSAARKEKRDASKERWEGRVKKEKCKHLNPVAPLDCFVEGSPEQYRLSGSVLFVILVTL